MLFNTLVDLRQEFLFACALHGVVGEEEIQVIIGELPLGALPVSGRYDVSDLINQYTIDPDRLEKLLEEIEGVEGNSGAVVRAIVEVTHLQTVCSELYVLTMGPRAADYAKYVRAERDDAAEEYMQFFGEENE